MFKSSLRNLYFSHLSIGYKSKLCLLSVRYESKFYLSLHIGYGPYGFTCKEEC